MKTEYNGYQLENRPDGTVALMAVPQGICVSILPVEAIEAIHILADIGCGDENCPCHEAGRQKGLEAPREPRGV